MKGTISRLLALTLVVSSVGAKTYSDRTYLSPRPQGVNIALERTTWHKQIRAIDDDKCGGAIQVVPFYQRSAKDCDVAKYFGACNSKCPKCPTSCSTSCDTSCDTSCNTSCGTGCDGAINTYIGVSDLAHFDEDKDLLESRYILHNSILQGVTIAQGCDLGDVLIGTNDDDRANPVNLSTLRDRVKFRPEQDSVGVRIDYHQRLDVITKGLYFKLNLPVVHARNCFNVCTTTSGCANTITQQKGKLRVTESTTDCVDYDDLATLYGATPKEVTLRDYLAGNVSNDATEHKQEALKKMKWKCGCDSATGIADIDFVLGYNFAQEDWYHVGVNLGFTAPTGNTPNGNYIFEARYGNGGHWAIKAGFDSAVRFWNCDDCSFDFLLALDYSYLFEAKEVRAPMFNTTNANAKSWNLYILGDKNTAKAGDALFPLANVLTRDYKITPGSQLDMLLGLAFNYCGFTLDVGYNLYYREEERARICGACGTSCDTSCNTGCSTGCTRGGDLTRDCGSCGDCSTSCCTDPCNSTCTLPCGWEEIYGVADLNSITSQDFGAANTGDFESTVPYLRAFDANSKDAIIKRCDLRMCSIQTPSVLTHKVYGGLGYAFNDWDYPLMLGVHGSYEFASDNSAFDQWLIGGKVGLRF